MDACLLHTRALSYFNVDCTPDPPFASLVLDCCIQDAGFLRDPATNNRDYNYWESREHMEEDVKKYLEKHKVRTIDSLRREAGENKK